MSIENLKELMSSKNKRYPLDIQESFALQMKNATLESVRISIQKEL
jgi:hypothetical protein